VYILIRLFRKGANRYLAPGVMRRRVEKAKVAAAKRTSQDE